jgi:hypothetical protein
MAVDTTPDYVPYLLAGQVSAGRQAGVDLYAVAREVYVTNLSLLALIGMVIKALNDHGVILDAEWLTRLNAAYQGPWPANMLNQIDPNKVTP